jgi:hypothetical protein
LLRITQFVSGQLWWKEIRPPRKQRLRSSLRLSFMAISSASHRGISTPLPANFNP